MLIFENPGELDLRLATTFGANVKEGDSPIGFFGTGMKYALAVAARTRTRVIIQIGLQVYELQVKPTSIRGKQFDLLFLNDIQLPFTTELGKGWKPWMAYREFLCNALDEGGDVRVGNYPEPEAGVTRFCLVGVDFDTVHAQREQWFIPKEKKPWLVLPGLELYEGKSDNVFYRGVAVGTLPLPTLAVYNLTQRVELTEDRTLKYPWDLFNTLGKALSCATDVEFCRALVQVPPSTVEAECNYFAKDLSEQIKEEMSQAVAKGLHVNKKLLEACRKADPARYGAKVITPSALEAKIIAKAVLFLEQNNIKLSHPIRLYETLGHDHLGQAADNEIQLAQECLRRGVKMTVGTIYEEHIHLTNGYGDCCRDMQNFLIDTIITMMEEKTGEPL